MAITITPELTGQTISSTKTYKYLFEPLRVQISDGGADFFYVDIETRNYTGNTTGVYSLYAAGELDASGDVEIDLMEIARDLLIEELYKISDYSEISELTIIPFCVNYSISTDQTTTPVELNIVPILGGRNFEQYSVNVSQSQPLTEFDYYGLSQSDFKYYPKVIQSLVDPTIADITPTLTKTVPTTGKDVCGGYLIWKSRFGGWMSWGFDIMTEDSNINYNEEVEMGLFKANDSGNPYIPTNYTSIDESYSVTLKSLGVSKDYAKALKGLSASPVCYLMREAASRMELMRINSASIPLSNLTEGVDITISLSSISKPSQNIR